jgi:hypothetical protein
VYFRWVWELEPASGVTVPTQVFAPWSRLIEEAVAVAAFPSIAFFRYGVTKEWLANIWVGAVLTFRFSLRLGFSSL